MTTNHRYLDVLTVRSSNAGLGSSAFTSSYSSSDKSRQHNKLLIEPIILPSLDHIPVNEDVDDLKPCLFYPNGEKNRNIRREIEHTVVKHHLINRNNIQEIKGKSFFRVEKIDQYANAKGPPIFYGRKRDPKFEELLKNVRHVENKIHRTVDVIV